MKTSAELVRTGEGQPSIPRNLSVVVLSPESVLVSWIPSLQMNGASVKYILKWGLANPNNAEFSILG